MEQITITAKIQISVSDTDKVSLIVKVFVSNF